MSASKTTHSQSFFFWDERERIPSPGCLPSPTLAGVGIGLPPRLDLKDTREFYFTSHTWMQFTGDAICWTILLDLIAILLMWRQGAESETAQSKLTGRIACKVDYRLNRDVLTMGEGAMRGWRLSPRFSVIDKGSWSSDGLPSHRAGRSSSRLQGWWAQFQARVMRSVKNSVHWRSRVKLQMSRARFGESEWRFAAHYLSLPPRGKHPREQRA